MKILHVITSLRTGGAEKLMVDLLPRLKAKGLDVDLLLFDGTDTLFRRDVEAAGIKVYDLGIGGSVYSPKRLLKLIPYLKKYNVVHTHNTAPQLFAAIGGVLCSVVLCTTEHNTSNRRRGWRWYAAIDRWMYSRYSHVICISQKAEENLRASLKSDSDCISTVNNGIDTRVFANALPAIDIRAKFPVDARIITMVAAFRWEKDQPTLIRAIKQLPENFHLILVGAGVRQDECRQLAESIGVCDRVRFLGLRTDVPSVLKASDYIVMSSHFEGLSLSSLEGMSAGKPFLASDVDGLREVVKGAGVLFPHEDSEALAREILHLDSDPVYADEVAKRCVKRAADYDIEKMVNGYINVYNNILK